MSFDIVIRGGTIVDGTGLPGYAADVGVRDGRIVEIGRITDRARLVRDFPGRTERYVVDAEGYAGMLVNGEILFESGRHTGALPGHVLRGG